MASHLNYHLAPVPFVYYLGKSLYIKEVYLRISENMSIPIDFQTEVNVQIGNEMIRGVLFQLKDGSLYLINPGSCNVIIGEVMPVSRSWAGMILRESVRETMRVYALNRKTFKTAKYSFRKTGNEHMFELMNESEQMSSYCFTLVKHQRKCWKKFKMKSTKVKKPITDQQYKEGQEKKEAAMKARKTIPEGTVKVGESNRDITITHTVSMENFQHGPK
jgi:hypothetical protein